MSGERSGVQRQIRDRQPKALYMHCAGQSLNLTIVHSCSVPQVRNCIDQIKDFTLWLKASPKREGLLKSIYEHGIQQTTTSLCFPLLNVCVTREWRTLMDGSDFHCATHFFVRCVKSSYTVTELAIMRCSLTIDQLKTREMLLLT